MRQLRARPAAFIYALRTFQKGPPLRSAPANPLAEAAALPANGRQPEPAPSVTHTGRGRARRPAGILEPSCAFLSPPPQPPTAPQRTGGGASHAREPMRALQRPHSGDDTGERRLKEGAGAEKERQAANRNAAPGGSFAYFAREGEGALGRNGQSDRAVGGLICIQGSGLREEGAGRGGSKWRREGGAGLGGSTKWRRHAGLGSTQR